MGHGRTRCAPTFEISFMFDIYETAGLTEYAITSRYPGDWEPVTEEEYRKAVEQAKMVYTWVEKIIG